MACFIVPATEAIVTTVIAKVAKNKEKHNDKEGIAKVEEYTIPFSKKLSWLNNMLWGGSALLAFEHVWHGEVTPFFPFLTAANNASDTAEMLHEMSTVGVSMAITVTAIWAVMVAVSSALEKKEKKHSHKLINS